MRTELRPLRSEPYITAAVVSAEDAFRVLELIEETTIVGQVFEDGEFVGYLTAESLRDLLMFGQCTPATVLELLQATGAIRLHLREVTDE